MRTGLLLAGLAAAGAAPAADAGWDWMVEPYLWAASIGTDVRTIDPPTESESESAFSELDGVFMGRIEGRNGQWGAFADFIYLGLSDSSDGRFAHTENDIDARLLDVAVSWRASGERDRGLDLFGGARYVDLDLNVRFEPNNPARPPSSLDAGASFFDALLGARYTWAFPGRWGMAVRGDASWGQTEGTWSASLMGSYRTGNGGWLFGYRYLEGKLGNDNADVTLDLSGPVVGYAFRF
ncbi:hypothetical protein [Pseudoxanthomonas koreensis]|uniref:hypothetical protein n=1 Tax=Pseudoxanthomonas koreensis TaxID=266061 RepID=UPI001391B049|nr:hypothetical protein [Pseudoxanthomonas koreensis]